VRSETIAVDWSAPGLQWRASWSLGFGSADQKLGIKRYRDMDPLVPSAVAALPGGSFAVVDPAHHRVVEVSSDGQVGRTIVEVPDVASDIAWDSRNRRLLVIANESHGQLIEIPAAGVASTVTMGRPVSRLTPTPEGVYEGGPSSSFPLRLLPSPLAQREDQGPEGLVLEDKSTVTFSSNQSGSRWHISRGSKWTLNLKFVGRNGPKPVLSLMSDMLVVADTLVMAPLVGTFATGVDLTRQLLLIRVDLKTGALRDATHVSQCGLTLEENLVSRFTADRDGILSQLCVGPTAVELRRAPLNQS
jgi:hypothetical protein